MLIHDTSNIQILSILQEQQLKYKCVCGQILAAQPLQICTRFNKVFWVFIQRSITYNTSDNTGNHPYNTCFLFKCYLLKNLARDLAYLVRESCWCFWSFKQSLLVVLFLSYDMQNLYIVLSKERDYQDLKQKNRITFKGIWNIVLLDSTLSLLCLFFGITGWLFLYKKINLHIKLYHCQQVFVIILQNLYLHSQNFCFPWQIFDYVQNQIVLRVLAFI
eukprot:TRINITY_DN995_c0_g1_i1.p1 TRINITY_DN995_c0_g1~~TRINITY_DN995_c0_g1_i1.p1  ORF type:complete len:218 (+),score=-8.63 TRINITY_DN995_c0_g1_i1:1003-1656(+)